MSKKVGVVILGGTGFGAGELMRLLCSHPEVEVIGAVSSSSAGKLVSDFHPHLKGFYDVPLLEALPDASRYEKLCIFSSLPHGTSGATVASLLEEPPHKDLTIIDLSGDLRLKNSKIHEKWYGANPKTELARKMAVYSLPDVSKENIKGARLISNPGCLASATILALAPIVKCFDVIKTSVSAITGSSGAGRSLSETTHHAVRHANFGAYKVFNHQHEPEICEVLGISSLDFVAHRAPLSRGIYVTAFCQVKDSVSSDVLKSKIDEYYKSSPFVRVLESAPEIENVVGSNFCDVSYSVRENTIIAMSAIDNLIKGMAGTAIQNMNLALGFYENTGLNFPAMRPI